MVFLNWLPCNLAVGHTQKGTFSKTYGFVIANVSVEIMIHSVSEANVLELLEICFPKLGQIFHSAPLKLLNVVKLYCHICFIMTQETNSLIVLSFMNSAINLFLNYCNHYSMFKYFYGDILRYITICKNRCACIVKTWRKIIKNNTVIVCQFYSTRVLRMWLVEKNWLSSFQTWNAMRVVHKVHKIFRMYVT